MSEKAEKLQEIRDLARVVAQEIEREWPAWKKDLSKPKEVTLQAADQGRRRDRSDWRY